MRVRALLAFFLIVAVVSPVAAAPVSPGVAALVVGALGPCGDPCVVHGNNGGRIMVYEDAAAAIRRGARSKVVIDGYCASACMVLASRARPRVCITERATFAYHKTNRNRPIPVSGDVHAWIVRNGGYPEFSGTPGIMPNSAARRFWPVCT